MVDFSNLKKADVKETSVAKYSLAMLEGGMSLSLAPATDANKGYFNALLRRNKKSLRTGKLMTVSVIGENRQADREMYAEHVLKGWTVKDAVGVDVPFNKENALEFLTQLPDWIFDGIRSFASDASNFTNENIDVEDEVKN